MTRSAALLAGLAITLAPLASARADGPSAYTPCAGAPGVVPAACVVPPPAEAPARDIADRTHVSVVPTGNLVPAGEVDLSAHEIYFWRLAFGLSDRVEVSMSMPIIPIVTNFGARVSLTDRDSPLRVVVGAGAWFATSNDSEVVGQGTITVAYQTESTNLHATATTLKPMSEEDTYLFGYAIGVLHKFHPKAAFAAELTRFAAVDRCYDCGGHDVDTFHGGLLGVKLMGERTDVDLGFFIPFVEDDDDVPALPVLSVNRRW